MYKGFLIAGFETGFHTTKEPWLAPQDAFVQLDNARCENGILTKRAGTSHLAQMIHDSIVQTTSITGLHCHTAKNRHWLIACDTARCNIYDPHNSAMIDVSGGANIFSGRDSDLFWYLTYDDKTYMTNFQDEIYVFNGDTYEPSDATAITKFDASLSTTTSSKKNTARILFHMSDRLLAYDIIEDGDHMPFRLRYTDTFARGNTPTFSAGHYIDVPTDDKPVTGRKLGRNLYLWHEKTLWVIKPSGNSDIPFVPDRIRPDLGSQTTHVCIPFEKGFMTVGHKDLIHFDGYTSRKMNLPHLNNILEQFEWSALKYSWGIFDETNQRIYITFAASGSTLPDRILEYSITEKQVALHKIPAHTLAMFNGTIITGWDDMDAAYGDDEDTLAEMPIDAVTVNVGEEAWFPVYGGRDGWVWRMFTGTSDNDVEYDFAAKTARLNPFSKEGRRCSLAQIAVLVDTSTTASFTLSLYKNTSSTAYKTKVITCTGEGDRHWETMQAGGEIGDFHQLGFSNDAKANVPAIHATWLEFEPAGWLNP